jgi:hypothetical protein
MSPLLFVNWRRVNSLFCAVMWIVAIVLAAVIIGELMAAAPHVQQAARLAH